MRRAMRHGELLGAREPLMWKLVPALVREMGAAYPELVRAEALISETLKLEETRFRKTLERGLSILEGQSKHGQVAAGRADRRRVKEAMNAAAPVGRDAPDRNEWIVLRVARQTI